MRTKTVLVIAALALVAGIAAIAYAQGAQGNTATSWEVKGGFGKGWEGHWAVGKAGRGAGGWETGKGCGGRYLNTTLYATTRQLTISGDGISVSLTVDVVNRNATSPYGRIIYGTGTVQLGGNTYTAKSVSGAVAPNGARITVYTGKELIAVRYYNGKYYAVVKTFGQPGYQSYNGTATLNIS